VTRDFHGWCRGSYFLISDILLRYIAYHLLNTMISTIIWLIDYFIDRIVIFYCRIRIFRNIYSLGQKAC